MSSNIPKQDAQVSSNIAKDQSFRLVSEPPGAISDEKGRTAVIIRPAGSRINTIKVWLFFGLYIAIITILLVFFFYFLFGNAVDQQRIYSVLNSVSKIMKDPPIADFYATNNTCLFDYDPVSLGQWPGIEHGCYYTEEKTVKVGNCNQEKKGLGVQTIPGETINTWQGYTFCIRKYHSIAIEYDGDCPYGFQKCGRYLCVLEQEKCPITSITWVDGVPANDTTEEIVSADTVNQHYFKIQRSAAKEPLVAFSISYNGMPCLDTISIPYPEQNYPLLSAKPGCRYGQNFETVTINSLPEPNFFSSLSAYDRVKSLPLIDDYSLTGTAYLVGLNRFRVKPDPTCSNPEQFFIMGRVNDAADKITRLRTLFLITVLFGVVIILFLSCDQRKTSAGISSVDLSMREKNGQFIFVLCILLSLLTLCCMLIVKPYVQLIKSYRDSLQVYSQNKCFMNNFITTALTDFANGPPYEAALFYQIIIVIGCLSLVPILLMIYEKCKPKPDPKDILIKNPDEE